MGLQRRVFSRSNIGAIFINKQSLREQPGHSSYNRNVGFEYNLASSNNLWTGKALVLKSFGPNNTEKSLVHAANLKYASGNLNWNWRHEYVSENYVAEVGYVPRTGYYKLNPSIGYLFFPRSKHILNHGPQLSTILFFDKDWQQTDHLNLLEYNFRFRSQSTLNLDRKSTRLNSSHVK